MLASLTSTLRRLTGVTVLALLLAAPPWALLHYLDRPWPHRAPTWPQISALLTSPLTDRTLGALLIAMLWLAWASFAWSVLAELAAAVTGWRLPQPRALAPARGLAALLVALITGGMLATAAQAAPGMTPPAQAAPAAATEQRAVQLSTPDRIITPAQSTLTGSSPGIGARPAAPYAVGSTPGETRAAAPIGRLTLVAAGREYSYTVQRGDSLSEIADQCLGDANRWPEIYALNRGTHFSEVGGTLTNPNLIYPGWTLHLPDDATAPHGTPLPSEHTGPAGPTEPPTQAHPKPDPPQPAPGESAAPTTSSTTPTAATAPAATVPSAPAGTASEAASAGPTSTGSTGATAPTTATDENGAPTAGQHGPRGVSLLSGSWIDLGLALAIAAAVTLVWAHRRRRYAPRPPQASPRSDDRDLIPMPVVVTQIRRGLRTPAAGTSPTDVDFDALLTSSETAEHRDNDDIDAEEPPAGAELETRGSDKTQDDHAEAPDPEPVPVVPALAHALAAVWPPAGVGLVGPGAGAAARGFFVAGLASGGLDDPDGRTWVVMPSATAATLLGTAAVTLANTPRLTVTAGLDEALDLLEAQTLHRTRLVYQHEADNVAALRIADPYEEPLPPILLIADASGRHERTRVAALLAQGQRLDIHGVLLGDWPDGNTIDVAVDGTTSPADGDATRHGAHPADVGRLSVIDPIEAADLIATLAESHTGRPQPAAPTGHHPASHRPAITAAHETAATDPREAAATALATPTHQHDSSDNTEQETTEENGVPAVPAEPTASALTEPAATPDLETAEAISGDVSEEPDDDGDDAEDEITGPGRVEVNLLGGATIVDADPQRAPRPKSLELLVYLAANDGSATVDAILEDLLPDAPARKAGHRLHTYVSDLRGVLRHNGGPGEYITHPRLRYLLNPTTVGVDLWQMRAAIAEAASDDEDERIAALRRAVSAYRGALAEGHDYLWIEPYREAARRQALDATTALADVLVDEPEEQIAILTSAIVLHPYAEYLYQAAMRAHAKLGHLEDIRALRRAATKAAAELDVEPDDDTLALADRLVTDLQSRDRRVPLQPGPGGSS